MKLWLCALMTGAMLAYAEVADKPTVFLLVGAAGEEEFGKHFAEAAGKWEKVVSAAQAKLVAIGTKPAQTNDLAQFHAALEAEPKSGPGEVWFVLLGHGTFDNKEAKFFSGQDVPFQSGTTSDAAGTTASFEQIAVGIGLNVRPRVTNEKNVAMEIEVLRQSVQDMEAAAENAVS